MCEWLRYTVQLSQPICQLDKGYLLPPQFDRLRPNDEANRAGTKRTFENVALKMLN